MIDLLRENNIIGAFGMAILLSVSAGLGSLLLGVVIALMRISPITTCKVLGALYVNTVRNTPLVLIIIACNIVLSVNLGLTFSENFVTNNIIWAIIGLSVYHAAYVCEALRSGVNTIPQGQTEAARSIGLTFGQTCQKVLLPQALRASIGPLGTTAIALIKNTTIATAIGVAEVSGALRSMQESRPDLAVPILFLVAMGFVVLTLPVGVTTSWLGRRFVVLR